MSVLDLLIEDTWLHMRTADMFQRMDWLMLAWAYQPVRHVIPKAWRGRQALIESAYANMCVAQREWISYEDGDMYAWQWNGFFDNLDNVPFLSTKTIPDTLSMPLMTVGEDITCLLSLLTKCEAKCLPFFECLLTQDLVTFDALFDMNVFEKLAARPYAGALLGLMEKDAGVQNILEYINYARDLFEDAARTGAWDVISLLYHNTHWCHGTSIHDILRYHSTVDAMECFYHCGGEVSDDWLVHHIQHGHMDVVRVILAHEDTFAIYDSIDEVRAAYIELTEEDDDVLACLLKPVTTARAAVTRSR